jgi:hypothetical protein
MKKPSLSSRMSLRNAMLSSESSGAWTDRSSTGKGKIAGMVRFELLTPHTDFLAPSMRGPPESPSRVPP